MAGESIKAKDVLKVGQRVEFTVGDDGEKYLSRIEELTENSIVVDMPMTSQRVPVVLGKGERVFAQTLGSESRYKFSAVIKSNGRLENGIPVWNLSFPEKAEYCQNREFFRVRITHRIKVKLVDEEGHIGNPLETRTVDLSGNGVGFVMNEPVKEGTMAGLELCEIPEVGTLEVMSRLVRCTRITRADGIVNYYVGAHFEQLSPADMNKIVRYLFAVQRKTLAKGVPLA